VRILRSLPINLLLPALMVFCLCGCVTTAAPTEPLNIPNNAVFYINISNDNLKVYQSISSIIGKCGYESVCIRDKSEIPAQVTPEISGTAFFVAPNLLVTNAHVVSDTDTAAFYRNGVKETAKVVFRNTSNDIAILQTGKDFDVPCFEFVSANGYEVGDAIYALGYPLPDILGTDIRVTNGIISSLSGLASDGASMQISCPIQPGNSGGPVVNDSFNVVGIATYKVADGYVIAKTGNIAQSINFAIKGDVASLFCADFISANPTEYVDSLKDSMNATVQVVVESRILSTKKQFYIDYGYNAPWDLVHYTASSMNMTCIDLESGKTVGNISKSYFSLSSVYDIAKNQIAEIRGQTSRALSYR